MTISFTPRAEADLDAIFAYIAIHDIESAKRIIARIVDTIEKLERFPQLGRVGRVADTRELPIAGMRYLAVYHLLGNGNVEIIAVMHERQLFPAKR